MYLTRCNDKLLLRDHSGTIRTATAAGGVFQLTPIPLPCRREETGQFPPWPLVDPETYNFVLSTACKIPIELLHRGTVSARRPGVLGLEDFLLAHKIHGVALVVTLDLFGQRFRVVQVTWKVARV